MWPSRASVYCGSVFLAAGILGGQPVPPANQGTLSPRIFEHVFRHVVFLKQKSDEWAVKGVKKTDFRSFYKYLAQLTDAQANMLEAVATASVAELDAQDKRAAAVIRAARASRPNRKLLPGEKPPAPPPELVQMQKERNGMLTAQRDHLKQMLGDAAFARLEQALIARYQAGALKMSVETPPKQ